MAKPLKVQLPPPSDQNDFEDLCEDIAKEYWQDPTAHRFGTQGHKQHGIDIVSTRAKENGEYAVFAIQCKKKKLVTRRKLLKSDIDSTLPEAEKFSPPLSRLIFATTSSKSTKIQTYINELNVARSANNQFPLVVWFWEDIEKILQEECQSTYIKYLKAVLPENGKATLSKDLLSEMLRVSEELILNNYIERARGSLSVIEEKVSNVSDKNIKHIFDRVSARVLLKEGKFSEGTNLLLRITEQFESDIESWAILYGRYIEDHNFTEASRVIEVLKRIDRNHRHTKNAELIYKYYKEEEISYVNDEDLNGTDVENATACLFCHLYANKKGDLEKRNFYLEKHRSCKSNFSSPIVFDILYKVWDLVEDLNGLSLDKIRIVSDFILEKEKELEKKNPITKIHELQIIFEKLRLEVIIVSRFQPRHEIKPSLREAAISKICKLDMRQSYPFLIQLLKLIYLEKEELSVLIEYVKNSGKDVESDLAYLILAQTLLNDKSYALADKVCADLSLARQKEYLDGLKTKNYELVLSHLRGVDHDTLNRLISVIQDNDLSWNLINSFDKEKNTDSKNSLALLKIISITQNDEKNYLNQIKAEVDFKELGYGLLNEIADSSARKKLWDLESESLRHMLNFEVDEREIMQNQTRLALSLFNLEDYAGVLEKKELLIGGLDKLSDHNKELAIRLLIASANNLGRYGVSHEILTATFSFLSNKFEFHFFKADVELKLEKYDDALTTILEGLRLEKNVTREKYQSCYMLLNELSNAGAIKKHAEESVIENVYIKISGIDSWFYIGNKKEIDALKLEPQDERYLAVFGKQNNSIIDWPVDRFQSDPPKRTLERIFSEGLYVRSRAEEAIHKIAQEGSDHLWGVNFKNPEEGVENIRKLWEQLSKPSEEFYETYINGPLPFSFLAKFEHGIDKAIGKINAKQQGFIHVNDRMQSTEKYQVERAHKILDGSPVFIDALSLLFLIGSNTHKSVLENIKQIFYTPSVSTCMRKHASEFAQSRFQMGSISFIEGKIYVSDYDHEKELEIKNKFLDAVEFFERIAKKVTTDFLTTKKIDLENLLHSGITDPYAAARFMKADIISDDFYYHKALELQGKEKQITPISSAALMWALYQKGRISYEMHLNYISYLLRHRCKHIGVSAPILLDSILVKGSGGILSFEPKNIKKFHLDITLSSKYGVTPEIASRVISEFLVKLIQDSSITENSFGEIMGEFLPEALKDRRRDFGDHVIKMCGTKINNNILALPKKGIEAKFNILKSGINNHFLRNNPIISGPSR